MKSLATTLQVLFDFSRISGKSENNSLAKGGGYRQWFSEYLIFQGMAGKIGPKIRETNRLRCGFYDRFIFGRFHFSRNSLKNLMTIFLRKVEKGGIMSGRLNDKPTNGDKR